MRALPHKTADILSRKPLLHQKSGSQLAVSLTRSALRRFGVAVDMEQVAARTLRMPITR